MQTINHLNKNVLEVIQLKNLLELKKNLSIFMVMLMTLFIISGCDTESTTQTMPVQEEDPLVADEVVDDGEVEETTDEPADQVIEEPTDQTDESTVDPPAESVELGKAEFVFFDIGQGDSSLISGPGGETILVDTGRHDDSRIMGMLEKENVKTIDLLVLTHPHSDHLGNADEIINKYQPKEIWMSGDTHTSQTFERVIDAALESDADYHEPTVGETHNIGAFTLDILNPGQLTGDLNDGSVAFNLTYGDITVLYTGDAENNAEQAMVNSGLLKKVDILKVGHHGSHSSSHSFFLDKVMPTIAIYSAGSGNSYGHPHKESLANLNNVNAKVYGTDVNGTIRVTSNGKDYNVITSKEGTPAVGAEAEKKEVAKEPAQQESAPPVQQEQAPAASNCIDINNASEEAVQGIKHIGPARSKDLISNRPYTSVSELTRIKGIGPARIADIESQGKACVK